MADDDRAASGSGPYAAQPSLADLHLSVSRRLRAAYAEALRPYGISPHQARALRAIRDAGPVRPSRLAETLHIAPRSVTDVIDDLQAQGLVTRSADPDDRRAQLVALTDAGVDLLARSDAHRTDAASALFGRLSPRDRDELARLLQTVLND